jgi:hypothetical protein
MVGQVERDKRLTWLAALADLRHNERVQTRVRRQLRRRTRSLKKKTVREAEDRRRNRKKKRGRVLSAPSSLSLSLHVLRLRR